MLTNAASKTCPRCAEDVKSAALVCRFCGFDFKAKEVEDEFPILAQAFYPDVWDANPDVAIDLFKKRADMSMSLTKMRIASASKATGIKEADLASRLKGLGYHIAGSELESEHHNKLALATSIKEAGDASRQDTQTSLRAGFKFLAICAGLVIFAVAFLLLLGMLL